MVLHKKGGVKGQLLLTLYKFTFNKRLQLERLDSFTIIVLSLVKGDFLQPIVNYSQTSHKGPYEEETVC